MRDSVARNESDRLLPILVSLHLLLVATYGHAAVAYLTTDADHFPEQPPGWAWPAVAVAGVGAVPTLLCLALSPPRLTSAAARARRRRPAGLVVATSLTGLMLLLMATPPNHPA